jgi:hypothetical protein
MSRVLFCLVSAVAMLSLASTSNGVVIGDFENGIGSWDNTWEGKAGLSIGTLGVTSGSKSLVLTPVKNGFSWALRYNCPAPIDFTKFKRLTVDVTWVASEWTGSGMWIQFSLMAINSNGASGWQQSAPSDPFNAAYPGGWDPVNWGNQTRTLTWDLSKYDATGATWMQLVFSTNMGGVETAGNYYIDNVRLLPAQPKVAFVSFHTADETASAGAATVGFTAAPDKGYTDLLKANGFNVVRVLQSATPDANTLNAADLVIISRSVGSTSFQNAAATSWNTLVTAPMINTGGYTLRKNRLGFSTGNTIPDTTGIIKLTASDAKHPIFKGVSLTNGTMDANFAGLCTYPDGTTIARGISVNTDAVPATGTVIATVSADSNGAGPVGAAIVAEWPAGASVIHDGGAGTDVLAGRRMTFLTGSREANGKNSEGTGMIDLTDDGKKLFINAVNYLVPTTLVAAEPRPADGTTGIPLDGTLIWDAGKLAVKHEVYISSKKDDVVSGKALVDVVDAASYNLKPLKLNLSTTYYWKIVEVSGSQKWASEVWSFTTIDYIAVEDFESYDNAGIAKTWVDGFKVDTGIACGVVPVVASTPVHGGKKAMALAYDCTKNPFLVEVKRTFSSTQDWTTANAGATTLTVFFAGDPNNSVQPLYLEINGYILPYTGDAGNIRKSTWTAWNVSLATLPIKVWEIRSLNIVCGYPVQHIPPTGGPLGGKGTLFIDDIRLYRVAP